MGKSLCCDKVGVKRGPWTSEEDHKLTSYILLHGHGSWETLPPKAGLKRSGKSCRLRWTNYLSRDIKKDKFSLEEEQTIIQLHALLGNKWSAIASYLPKRTDNMIKNYWNTRIKKRIYNMGIDPMTHQPRNRTLISCGHPKDIANLSHIAQWENTRLEAEARIVRESKSQSNSDNPTFVHKPMIQPTPLRPRPPCLDILTAWQATKYGNKTVETPTSIFKFPDNMLVGVVNPLIHDNSLALTNPSIACMNKLHQDEERNVVDLTFSSYVDSSLFTRLPSFLDLLPAEVPPLPSIDSTVPADPNEDGSEVYEDSKSSCWSDILNVENSCMDAFMF